VDDEEEAEEELDKSLSRILKDTSIKTYVEVNRDIIVKDCVDEPPKIMHSKETQFD
jgi:hypothetical protein